MSEIFRDRTEGAIARRQELLRKRRDEFVMMPHAIRRVVVARAARKAAALAMMTAGSAMVIVAMSPKLTAFIARGLPGINPAVISTFVGATWLLGLVAFAISRGRAEHRFAVEMSKTVLPGQDLDDDLERLTHEQPDAVARRMAHRLEIASAALPVAAAAFVLPATFMYVAQAVQRRGWPTTADYEANLAHYAGPLAFLAVAGLFAALAVTRRGARSPKVAAPALVIAAASAAVALFGFVDHSVAPMFLAGTVALIAAPISVINWRLAKERIAIEADDPAAGSELFTLRGAYESCKRGIVSGARRIPRRVAFGSVALAAGLAVFIPLSRSGHSNETIALGYVAQRAARPVVAVRPAPAPGDSSYTITPTTSGRLRIDATFVDGKPIDVVEGLSGMTTLPRGWKARVVVYFENDGLPTQIAVSPFPGDPSVARLHMGGDVKELRFSTEVCDDREQPLGLALVPDSWPKGTFKATFLVEPTLELSLCDNVAPSALAP